MMAKNSNHLLLLILLMAAIIGCGDEFDENDDGPELNEEEFAQQLGDDDFAIDDDIVMGTIPVSGKAYRFDTTFSYLEGAEVTVVERPDIPSVATDAHGEFQIDGVHFGDQLTLLATHPDFFPTQTATVYGRKIGYDNLTFQVPPRVIVWALALFLFETIDPDCCQIASTVTEAGGTPFSPGMEGVSVTIEPELPPEYGPFYFKIFLIPGWPMLDLPIRWLTETTEDGGMVFLNVPPGEYVLTAHKEGMEFQQAYIKCNPGVLVNASPPYGLQAVE